MNGNIYSQTNMSQVDLVLTHLIKHGKIKPQEAKKLYDIKYLAKCISRIKKKKINIITILEPSEKRDNAKVAAYVLARREQQPPSVNNLIDCYRRNYISARKEA